MLTSLEQTRLIVSTDKRLKRKYRVAAAYIVVISVIAEEHGLGLTGAADPPHGPCRRRHGDVTRSAERHHAHFHCRARRRHSAHTTMQIQ